jgi:hypothetical protein
MKKQKSILLMAALGLIMSALSAQTGYTQSVTTQTSKSASIQIKALPFNITTPGTYVLTGNLTSSLLRSGTGPSLGAINISTTVAGPVVVDLKGFTITGPGSNSFAVTIGALTTEGNTYPITIKNGTISNFEYGVTAVGTPTNQNNYFLSDIIVNNIVFDVTSTGTAVGYGINFVYVNSSTVSNCTFNGATYGIADYGSSTGNSYNGITFLNTPYPFIVWRALNSPFALDRCQFSAPPAQ